MKISLILIVLLLAICVTGATATSVSEFSGYVAVEGRIFFNEALLPEQERDSVSFVLQPEYYHEWENGSSLTAVPFARIDSADSERSHLDIRELNYLWLSQNWELRVGIGKVFWGVTEFVHLVDIINQTDLVEAIDGEDKLGQPMVNLSYPTDMGTFDLFVLPYFRERTFPGISGRLRSEPVVDTDRAVYESADEEHHIDMAIRYSHSIGDWDFGIYNFNGTDREPTLVLNVDENGQPALVPFYELINQTGLDLQTVKGNWLLKLEALYRTGQGDGFFAGVGGFEYAFVNIAQTGLDLGIVSEWALDERGDNATTPFQNDVMLGLRLELNDAASSRLLTGFSQDLENASAAFSVEASRRFGNNWLLSMELRSFYNLSEDDPFFSVRDDGYVQLELAYYL